MTNQDQRDLAASQAGLPSETLQARNGCERGMTSYERFLEYCDSNPECPYGSDEKWAAKLGWDAQERHFQSRIATLEAVVKVADEMEYLLERVPFYTLEHFSKKYERIITAYRQAKERVK